MSTPSWTLSPNTYPIRIFYGTSIVNNNYVYVFGGITPNSLHTDLVYYAKLNSDGSTSSWIPTTSLPNNIANATSVVNNNYVYIFGGLTTNYISLNTVYYAKLNNDGSVGSWTQSVYSLPINIFDATSIINNNYAYVIGGNSLNTVYYAKLNNDGSIGPWNSTISLPNNIGSATSVVNNNYVYVVGGRDNYNNNSYYNTVYYAKINNTDGTVGEWVQSTYTLPINIIYATSIVNNNYIYVICGNDDIEFPALNTVYYTEINNNGLIGPWNISSISPFPHKIHVHTSVVNNNYIYVIGGSDYSSTRNTVYYIRSPFPAPSSQSTALLYSTKINLAIGNTEIFNGYFTVFKEKSSDTQGVITHFYNTSNGGADIYINNNFGSEDSLYLINTNQFSYNGTNISSFPYLYDLCNNSVFYNLYQNGNRTKPDNRGRINSLDINGKVLQSTPVIFTNTFLSESNLLYSTQINLTNNTKIFDGVFNVQQTNPSDISGLVTNFYDLTDLSRGDIYINNGGDHVYFINDDKFSSSGTNITSFPYFKNIYSNSAFYNLYNDPSGGVNILTSNGSNLDTVAVNFTNTLISEPPTPTTLWYSIKIKLINNTEIFNGYFSVLQANIFNNLGVVNHFYDLTNYGVDIYTNNGFASEDSTFLINSAKFSSGGTNITSFPYLKLFNTNSVFYSLYRSGTDTVNLLDITGSILQSIGVTFINTQIPGPPPPPPPTTLWYSTKIYLLDNTEIFNGYFSMLQANLWDTSGVITHFYDLTNYGVDIYINTGQDSLFLINTNQFSPGGTNIRSFPYFNKLYPNSEFYKLYRSGTDNVNILTITGSVLQTVEVTFINTQISGPPPPLPPPPPVLRYNLFTNNAIVYYKKNSLAPCGVGSVVNSRIKSKET
jgi:N-acetylneuraminic acid mutarotase